MELESYDILINLNFTWNKPISGMSKKLSDTFTTQFA